MTDERKDFAELTLDEKANLRFLYQVGKGLRITKQTISITQIDKLNLEELFSNRSCSTIEGIWTVIKDTYFASYKYVYIMIKIKKRKNGEKEL
jgi:hypothetical protein